MWSATYLCFISMGLRHAVVKPIKRSQYYRTVIEQQVVDIFNVLTDHNVAYSSISCLAITGHSNFAANSLPADPRRSSVSLELRASSKACSTEVFDTVAIHPAPAASISGARFTCGLIRTGVPHDRASITQRPKFS